VGTVHPEHGAGFDLWGGRRALDEPDARRRSSGVWIPIDEVADAWEGVASIFRDYGLPPPALAGAA
jgi:sulfite reductase (ferredoxin)